MQPAPSTLHPNILVILTDQLRRDALGCYGDPNVSTPNIDRLAQGGVCFTNACSTYPICVPFRFTFMTGQYAHTRQVPGIDWRMSPAERTLADEFNEHGYDTMYVGKWHLFGGHDPRAYKTPVPREHQGRWQKWFGFDLRNRYFDTCCFENDDPTPHPLNGYQTDCLFQRVIDTLDKGTLTRPFACVLSVEAPHPPREAPAAYEARWKDRLLKLPPNFLVRTEYDDQASGWSRIRDEGDREALLHARRMYYAMIENLDGNVGRLMESLKKTGLAGQTIVVLTSDHGDCIGSHALDEKQYPFEESIGIPLLVHGPGCGIPAGGRLQPPVSTEDLFPTLLGLAGITPHNRLPGFDASHWIRFGQPVDAGRPGIMLEFVSELRPQVCFHNRPYRGFRSQRYKYTVWGNKQGLKPWQFFDLESDPHELHNRIADPTCQPQIRQHHVWLRDRMRETGDHEWLAATRDIEALNPCPAS